MDRDRDRRDADQRATDPGRGPQPTPPGRQRRHECQQHRHTGRCRGQRGRDPVAESRAELPVQPRLNGQPDTGGHRGPHHHDQSAAASSSLPGPDLVVESAHLRGF
jgi:hypothetical protein